MRNPDRGIRNRICMTRRTRMMRRNMRRKTRRNDRFCIRKVEIEPCVPLFLRNIFKIGEIVNAAGPFFSEKRAVLEFTTPICIESTR